MNTAVTAAMPYAFKCYPSTCQDYWINGWKYEIPKKNCKLILSFQS